MEGKLTAVLHPKKTPLTILMVAALVNCDHIPLNCIICLLCCHSMPYKIPHMFLYILTFAVVSLACSICNINYVGFLYRIISASELKDKIVQVHTGQGAICNVSTLQQSGALSVVLICSRAFNFSCRGRHMNHIDSQHFVSFS